MARTPYTCPVCGKVLKLGGVRNIEFHEKSAFHIAAMKQGSEQHNTIKPVPSITPENVPEINGIQTTVMEDTNVKNKETTDRNEGRNEGSEEWDGYLC